MNPEKEYESPGLKEPADNRPPGTRQQRRKEKGHKNKFGVVKGRGIIIPTPQILM